MCQEFVNQTCEVRVTEIVQNFNWNVVPFSLQLNHFVVEPNEVKTG